MKELLRLLTLFSGYKLWIAGGVVVSLVSMLANVALMAMSGWFIAAMGVAGVFGAAINYFTPAAVIRACAILRTGGRYAERLVTHEATFRIIAQLRCWLYEHLEPLAPAVLSKKHDGDVLGRLRGDVDLLERFYLNFLVPVSVGVLAAVIVTVVAYSYHPVFAAIFGCFFVVSGLLLPLLAFFAGRRSEEYVVDLNAEICAEMVAGVQGMGERLVYGDELRDCALCDVQYKSFEKYNKYLNLLDCCTQNMAALCINVAVVPALVAAAYLAQKGGVSFPDVAMLTLLVLASYEIVQPLVPAARSLGGVIRAARRVFDIVDREVPVQDKNVCSFVGSEPFSLEFDNVSFGYDPSFLLFKGFDFEVKAGQKVLVCGASGAGKSSLINLSLRFWEPQGGRIALNGRDMGAYNGAQAREYFSVVMQSPHIFADTLRRNLLIARPEATEGELDAVCEAAGLSEMIAGLPDGYDTYVGENGRKLSGGQVKRVALARALLKGAPCLILDEVGEGLDYEMERDILLRVMDFLDGAALIYVTHRQGVGDLFDRVVFLES